MTLTKDPKLLYPLVFRIQTPTGMVDLQNNLPARSGITLRALNGEEVAERASKLGIITKDPSTCEADSLGAAPQVAGRVLTIQTEHGAPYALVRHIRALTPGQVVGVTENYSSRYTLRHWQNAIVQTQPETPFYQHAQGTEFHNLTLELLIVGGIP